MEQREIANKYYRIKQKWIFIKVMEVFFMASAIALTATLPLRLFLLEPEVIGSIIGILLLLLGGFIAYKMGLFSYKRHEIARYLNQHFEELENSAELLIAEATNLTSVEAIQKKRIEDKFASVAARVRISHRLPTAILAFLLGVLLWLFLPMEGIGVNDEKKDSSKSDSKNGLSVDSLSGVPPEIKEATVRIVPPAYTRISATSSSSLRINAPENAQISWKINFTADISAAFLVFGNGDTIALKESKGMFQGNIRLQQNSFYSIVFSEQDSAFQQTDYFPIKVITDREPDIRITHPDQYLDIPFDSTAHFAISANASDDYGLAEAYIVATVSRGSGEAVKFREQKLFFSQSLTAHPTKVNLERKVGLEELEMAPGDELYYYIVVRDNKQPEPNSTRTETYFVNIPDTVSREISIGEGLGVDLMPEYFRSQRQIIIDTEDIIKNAAKLTKKEYQEGLNDLGIDQKLLRLRYGQFLGEEFESGITEVPSNELHDDHDDHDHDEGGHNHSHEQDNEPETEEELLHAYSHIHDYQGEATFFDEAIKAQLKAALSQMWEAELRLRTFKPKEALPFEYKALALIKDIQQKSRVYVERMGFEPPPLNPKEKRLTGDLSDISYKRQQDNMEKAPLYPAMEVLFTQVNSLLEDKGNELVYDRELMALAGQEVAGLALDDPGTYLSSLASFRILANETIPDEAAIKHLKSVHRALWKALPPAKPTPAKEEFPSSELLLLFQETLSDQQ